MSAKIEKPVIQGQRIKTRKRDEKVKSAPITFRDIIIRGFYDAGNDLEALQKYLDNSSSKLDYKQYGETLFDILIAGGILAPGGSVLLDFEDAKLCTTDLCLFNSENDLDSLYKWSQVFLKLIRRYKYLEKMFVEEIKKIMSFMHGFSPDKRSRLAKIMVMWISDGLLNVSTLWLLAKDHLVKDMLAANFMVDFFTTWLKIKDVSSLRLLLKKVSFESQLIDFFPISKRTNDYFTDFFTEHGLTEIVACHRQQTTKLAKRDMQARMLDLLSNSDDHLDDTVSQLKELNAHFQLSDADIVSMLWTTVMSLVEWSKKEELIVEQTVRHLKQYQHVLYHFTQNSSRAQLTLLQRVQDYCYDNMNFMKTFSKIVVLLYNSDVLYEDVILKWYADLQSGMTKGKTVFIEQMRQFVEWLKNAEEALTDEDEEDGEEEDEESTLETAKVVLGTDGVAKN